MVVKPPKSDPAPLRQRQADLTRRAILDAARALFIELGYANTPIRRIAEEAGVAVQTIYSAFGSKPAVLLGLIEHVDQETVAPIARRLMGSDDPAEMLTLMASIQRHVREAAGDFMRVLAEAAAADADVAKVWTEGFDRHRQGVAQVCQRLAKRKSLRKGLTVDDATATAMALTSVEAYEEVVRRREWSYDRYEQWLAAALRHALLGKG